MNGSYLRISVVVVGILGSSLLYGAQERIAAPKIVVETSTQATLAAQETGRPTMCDACTQTDEIALDAHDQRIEKIARVIAKTLIFSGKTAKKTLELVIQVMDAAYQFSKPYAHRASVVMYAKAHEIALRATHAAQLQYQQWKQSRVADAE